LVDKEPALTKGEHATFLTYAAFLSRNKLRIAAGLSLVVGLLLVIALVQSLRRRKEARAFEAHLTAQTAKEHRSVAGKYPGTFYGSVSLVEAGNLLFEKEKYGEARKLYQQYLRSHPTSRFRAWVYNLVGATFEAEEKYDDAIEYYRRAEGCPLGKPGESKERPLKRQAQLNLGRCWELKGDLESERDPQRALEHYDTARTYYRQLSTSSSPSPGSPRTVSPWERQAQSRMKFLQDKEMEARKRELEKRVDKDKG